MARKLDASRQEYYSDLLLHPEWIRRRVQTVQVIGDERFLRRVSLDISMEDVRKRLNCARRNHDMPELPPNARIGVPLGILNRELLLDFSVVDHQKNPLSLMTSDDNTMVWLSTLRQTIEKGGVESAAFCTRHRGGLDEILDIINSEMKEIIGPIDSYRKLGLGLPYLRGLRGWLAEAARPGTVDEILRTPTSYALKEAVLSYASNDDGWNRMAQTYEEEGGFPTPLQIREEIWRGLFDIPQFVEHFKLALGSFIPVVLVDDPRERCVVKYQYQTTQTESWSYTDALSRYFALRSERDARLRESELHVRTGSETRNDNETDGRSLFVKDLARVSVHKVLQLTGIGAARVMVDTSLSTFAAIEHLKVICPKGIYVQSYSYEPYTEGDGPQTTDDYLRVRATRERATLYTKSELESKPEFHPNRMSRFTLYMRPRLTGFRIPALVAVAVAAVLSFASWQRADRVMVWRNDDPPNLSALTTVLMITVSLLSYAAVRPGEHAYRSRLLNGPRAVVVLSCALVVLIAGCAVFHVAIDSIQRVAEFSFFTCLSSLAYLLFISLQGEFLGRRVAMREDVAEDPLEKIGR